MWSEVLVSEKRKEVQGHCKGILKTQWEEAQAPCVLGWNEAGATLSLVLRGILASPHFPRDSDGNHWGCIEKDFQALFNAFSWLYSAGQPPVQQHILFSPFWAGYCEFSVERGKWTSCSIGAGH